MSASRNELEVVAIETEEVEMVIGPRRIHGLVNRTAEMENEIRAARVYAQAAKVKPDVEPGAGREL